MNIWNNFGENLFASLVSRTSFEFRKFLNNSDLLVFPYCKLITAKITLKMPKLRTKTKMKNLATLNNVQNKTKLLSHRSSAKSQQLAKSIYVMERNRKSKWKIREKAFIQQEELSGAKRREREVSAESFLAFRCQRLKAPFGS